MLISFALSAVAFLSLHVLVEALTRLPFSTAFRLSRGLASIALCVLGFFALGAYRAHAGTVYVLPAPDPLASSLVFVPIGHFAADFVLLGWGFGRAASRPRMDLVIHHVLGLVAATLTLAIPVAAPLYLILFTTEMMPMTSGITTLGAVRKNGALERLGARLRLAVLVGWRIPLWIWVGVSIAIQFIAHAPAHDATVTYVFSSVFLLVMLSLDAYWTVQGARALRRMNGELKAAESKSG